MALIRHHPSKRWHPGLTRPASTGAGAGACAAAIAGAGSTTTTDDDVDVDIGTASGASASLVKAKMTAALANVHYYPWKDVWRSIDISGKSRMHDYYDMTWKHGDMVSKCTE